LSKAFITLGDRTSHGGIVISADMTFSINGKYVARVGDMTFCPKCKGMFPITSGAENMISMGQAPARDGDKTACGAVLIASQQTTTHTPGSAFSHAAASPDELTAASALIARETPTLCLECLQKASVNGAAFIVRG
jgi:uncharacterized Zn-binding protein involved in type VI secretion